MSYTSQGQFTIIDYNDAITLTGYIGSNLVKTQMYNPDNGTYNPDWTDTNLVLTPNLMKAGSSTDLITNAQVTQVKWYVGNSTTAISSGLSGAKSHILTISTNAMAGLAGIDYRCEITFKDATTQLELKHTMTVSFTRVVNGSGIVDLIVTTPEGNVFKNTSVTSLQAVAQLWRGSVIDTTLVTYQWYKKDPSVLVDEGGGIGWDKLTNTANMYSGTTTNTITVYPNAVDSYATFKCMAKDTDSTTPTYNTFFTDTASFIDNSDPIQVIIESSGGDVFKNGVGSTTLTAKVYQAGLEIDAGGTGTYVWSRYSSTGAKINFASGASTKTGKTLTVDTNDVNVKDTFICVVTI